MTIHIVNLKSGKKTKRDWTQEEIDAHQLGIQRDEERRTKDQKISEALFETEKQEALARKIEDIAMHITSGTPLPVNPKTGVSYVEEWLEKRALKREELK